MSGPVTFDPNYWRTNFPAFVSVPDGRANFFFSQATLYCANPNTLVSTDTVLAQLLYMLTSHIAALAPDIAQIGGVSGPVGRVASAGEGSANISLDNQYPPGTPQWYQQTSYGAAFWEATGGFRTMRWVGPQVALTNMIVQNWIYPFGG